MTNEMVQKLKTYLVEDGKAVKIVESYVSDTSAFVAFLESKGMQLNRQKQRFYITCYRSHLIDNQYELSTINKKIIESNLSTSTWRQWLHQRDCSGCCKR